MSGSHSDQYRTRGSSGYGVPLGMNFPNASSAKERGSPGGYVHDGGYRSQKSTSARTSSTGQESWCDDFSNLNFNDRSQSQGPRASSRTSSSGGPTHKNPTVEYDVHVMLEEVYHGCTKKVKIPRTVITPGDRVPRVEEKEFTIDVEPGWKAGTRITFQHEGEQLYGTEPGDVVFIIRDKPHPHFQRDGADIRYVAKIAFRKALRGGKIEVPTLTHGKVTVRVTDIITPTTVKRIPGQGLPHPKDPKTRGDLLLSFDIEYPRLVTETKSRAFWDALSDLI